MLDALSLAVSHSGDSDSTGAICGNILGTAHGIFAVPAELVFQVEGRGTILELADHLVLEMTAGARLHSDHGHDTSWSDRYPGRWRWARCPESWSVSHARGAAALAVLHPATWMCPRRAASPGTRLCSGRSRYATPRPPQAAATDSTPAEHGSQWLRPSSSGVAAESTDGTGQPKSGPEPPCPPPVVDHLQVPTKCLRPCTGRDPVDLFEHSRARCSNAKGRPEQSAAAL